MRGSEHGDQLEGYRQYIKECLKLENINQLKLDTLIYDKWYTTKLQ